MNKIALSGIKPTGELHIGNYLGMIKPAFELAKKYQALYFIADYHALTTVKDSKKLNDLVYSDIKKELFELLEDQFGKSRETYLDLVQDHTHLDAILSHGAEKARSIAAPKMDQLRSRIGIKRLV